MPRNGLDGTYTIPEPDFEYDTVIDEQAMNNIFDDIETALSQSVATDGQSPISADLPMSGYKHTGVGNAGSRNQYAAAGQVQDDTFIWCGTAGGTVNALTLTPSLPITEYVAGQRFRFIGAGFSTSALTVSISGLATKSIFVDSVIAPPDAIWTSRIYEILYDGTRFHLSLLTGRPVDVRRNYVVNPHFTIAQRGPNFTNIAGIPGYGLDQWFHTASVIANTELTQEAVTPGETGLPYAQPYFLRMVSTQHGRFQQPIEDVRTLAGKACTLTFWARSDTAGTEITPDIMQNFGSGGSATVTTQFSITPRTLSTSWDRYRQTVTLPSISGKTIGVGNCIVLRFLTNNNSSTIDFAYVQLEGGPSYTYMDSRPFAEEQTLCQRYYQTSYATGVTVGTINSAGPFIGYAANTRYFTHGIVHLMTRMRSIPTVTFYGHTTGTLGKATLSGTTDDKDISALHANEAHFFTESATDQFVGGAFYYFHWVADARL